MRVIFELNNLNVEFPGQLNFRTKVFIESKYISLRIPALP